MTISLAVDKGPVFKGSIISLYRFSVIRTSLGIYSLNL